jgi:O-antigen ligase
MESAPAPSAADDPISRYLSPDLNRPERPARTARADAPSPAAAHRILAPVATAALTLAPALMLTLRGGTGYCLFLVLACSLVHLASDAGHRREAAALCRRYPLLLAGLAALPLLAVLQAGALRTGAWPAVDPLLRLLLAIPCFTLLATLPSRRLRLVQWGFVAGALAAGAWAGYATVTPTAWTMPGRLGNHFTNPIPFGDTALLLGFLAVASLSRTSMPSPAEVGIKVIALLGGVYASFLSGSRGGWIAIPLLVWAALAGRRVLRRARARLAVLALLVACIVALAAMPTVRDRVEALNTDLQLLNEGDGLTSTGMRLELWRASLHLWLTHPVLGVGRGSLQGALDGLAAQGLTSRAIVNPHAHNDFFSVLAEMGVIGVGALALLYAGAWTYFWRERHCADPDTATAAWLGLSLTGATILFGLSIDVLTLVMNTAFYALTATTLLAWMEARRRECARARPLPAQPPSPSPGASRMARRPAGKRLHC